MGVDGCGEVAWGAESCLFVVHPREGLVGCFQAFSLVAARSGGFLGACSSSGAKGVGPQAAPPSGFVTQAVEGGSGLVVAACSAATLPGPFELSLV